MQRNRERVMAKSHHNKRKIIQYGHCRFDNGDGARENTWVADAVLLVVGVFGMGRAEYLFHYLIIGRALFSVPNDKTDRRFGGLTFVNP